MKRIFNRLASLMLSIIIILSMTAMAGAADLNAYEDVEAGSFAGYSTAELNSLIDAISSGYAVGASSSTDTLAAAWYAAAQIARNEGYPLAATLVEHSVDDEDYSEFDGDFAEEITGTSVYTAWFSKLAAGTASSSMTFTKKSSADLYYALHKVSVEAEQYGTTFWITVSDTFDFDVDANYDSLFSAIVNNWAWLSQQTGALNAISISISFIDGV